MDKPDRCRLRFGGACKDRMHCPSAASSKAFIRKPPVIEKKTSSNQVSLQVNHSLGLTFYCWRMSHATRAKHLLATAAVAVALGLAAGGCSNISSRDATGSLAGAGP